MTTIVLFQDAFSGKEVWVNPLESVGILIVILIIVGIVRSILKWADKPESNKVINKKDEYTDVFNEIWEKEKTDKFDDFNAGEDNDNATDTAYNDFKNEITKYMNSINS